MKREIAPANEIEVGDTVYIAGDEEGSVVEHADSDATSTILHLVDGTVWSGSATQPMDRQTPSTPYRHTHDGEPCLISPLDHGAMICIHGAHIFEAHS